MKRVDGAVAVFRLLGVLGLGLLILGLDGCGGPAMDPVEIRFFGQVGDQEARCGTRYEGVGALGRPVELSDARLYVSNFELHRTDGNRVPIVLDQESPWQHANVALLDFEDGSGRCSDSGTAQTNSVITGAIPAGDYTGLSFEVGVPWELDHLDALTAPSPLNLNALYWNWRLGYIFTKIEFWNDGLVRNEGALPEDRIHATGEPAPTVTYLAHVGSTGCESAAPTLPPQEACARPNRARIFLPGFEPTTDGVALDFAAMVDGIDITRSVLRPPGCMASPTDPDCRQVFANLGLDLDTGGCATDCSDQKLFRRQALDARELGAEK